ncbi:MAG TPA: DUF2089 domain-containing protein [Chloroflexota bacterium]|nr:DUF2089 domain-containing protein [Chloroflexota bacterium]
MPDVLGQCPVCGDELRVTRLACPTCQTAIEGSFSLGRLQRLSPDQLAFLEVFVRNRGVIREVEKELGVSYPTVRNRLDDLIRALGFEVRDEAEVVREAPEPGPRRRDVLEKLSRGELSAEQAIKFLQQ